MYYNLKSSWTTYQQYFDERTLANSMACGIWGINAVLKSDRQ